MRIGISGKKGSGKSFIANIVKQKRGTGEIFSFATPLKAIVREYSTSETGPLNPNAIVDYPKTIEIRWHSLANPNSHLDGALGLMDLGRKKQEIIDRMRHIIDKPGMTYGVALQLVGTEIFRNLDENFWVNLAKKRDHFSTEELIIYDDCRFPNEADSLDAVIRIDYTGESIVDGRDTKHLSETALDDYEFEFRLTNDGRSNVYEQGLDRFYEFVESKLM